MECSSCVRGYIKKKRGGGELLFFKEGCPGGGGKKNGIFLLCERIQRDKTEETKNKG